MQTIRALIEGWLKGRYGYEGNQAYWAIAELALIATSLVAIWKVAGPLLCVGTLALVLLALRSRLALPLLIGSILLIAWVLFGPGQRAAF